MLYIIKNVIFAQKPFFALAVDLIIGF